MLMVSVIVSESWPEKLASGFGATTAVGSASVTAKHSAVHAAPSTLMK